MFFTCVLGDLADFVIGNVYIMNVLYDIVCVHNICESELHFLKRKSFEAAYPKGLLAIAFNKVIKGAEFFYLSHTVIKHVRIISKICCKLILCFILTGEPIF